MKPWICLFSLTLILFTGLTGCINLGPDYQRPDLDIEIPESYENDQTEPTANPVIADRWWQDFGDIAGGRILVTRNSMRWLKRS
jgi:hypothetical protein